MKILADENITDVAASFAAYGEVVTVPGRTISNAMLRDIDVLLVRSITPVNAALLQGSPCRFVGTATSGIDHIDVGWLERAGIKLGWARGCNNISVVDYVFSCLARLSQQQHSRGSSGMKAWQGCSFGVIGCGQIGGALVNRLARLGMSFRIYDPFLRETSEYGGHLTMLDEVLQQDIITLHVPLTIDGPWPTFHMLNERTLSRIPAHSILINAARGAVIDNDALLDWMKVRAAQIVVLDTWENEPDINLQLLQKVQIGTAHIAGYSLEGKLKGTRMLVEQFCSHFGYARQASETAVGSMEILTPIDGSSSEQLNQIILAAYDVGHDHNKMMGLLDSASPAQAFDKLRKQYPIRHEFSNFGLRAGSLPDELKPTVRALGFQLVD